MQTLAQIRAILAANDLAPRKSLGQNFLTDHNLIAKLVDAAAIAPGDLVLEVGPGTGTLTEALLEHGATVIAAELDAGLANHLRAHFVREEKDNRFTLIEGDCLRSKRELAPEITGAIAGRPFKLVANLPYACATPLIAHLASEHPDCTAMHATIQKEVAQRLRAKPSTKEYGEVSVLVQALCDVSRIATLPPGCFWPPPKVTSEMISITRLDAPRTTNHAALARTVNLLFSQRRKQIGSLLPKDANLPEGIDRTARAEQLNVEQFIQLADSLAR